MKNLIMVKPASLDGIKNTEEILINEDQICSIEPDTSNTVLLRMSNGEFLRVTEPTWQEWKNDYLSR